MTTEQEQATEQVKVYFFLAAKSGHIKIGSSADVARRWYELSTNWPDEVIYLGSIIDPGGLEVTLHKKFDEFRVRKEWFAAETAIFEYVAKNCFKEDIQPTPVRKSDRRCRSAAREERRKKIKEARMDYKEEEKVLHQLLWQLGQALIEYHQGKPFYPMQWWDNKPKIRDIKKQVEAQRIKLDEIALRGAVRPAAIRSLKNVLVDFPAYHSSNGYSRSETCVWGPAWEKPSLVRKQNCTILIDDNDLKAGEPFRF
jgi:hypothetical protein